jgi:hypothetical protein
MRAPTIVCLLLATNLLMTNTSAGSLSRAREQVREDSSSHEQEESGSDSGTLDDARGEVRRDSEHHHDSDHHGGHHHDHHSHSGLSLGFFSFGGCDPYYPPPVYLESAPPVYVGAPQPIYDPPIYPSAATSLVSSFPEYPYADGLGGAMVTDGSSFGKEWSGQVQFEFGSGDDVDRSGGAFLLEGVHGFGIDVDWDSYREDLPGGGQDELHIGEFNLLYRIAESEHSLIRVGVGVAWLGDRFDTDYGVNFSIKADYMPRRPLVFSGELDLGTIGDAETLHAAGTVGVMLQRCELYGGYDYRRIGDVELVGPMMGLRVWF